jgi:hypothetical protein
MVLSLFSLLLLFVSEISFATDLQGAIVSASSARASVVEIVNHRLIKAEVELGEFHIGDQVPVFSVSNGGGPVGFVQVLMFDLQNPKYIYADLLRHSQWSFLQVGDELRKIDLSTQSDLYIGTTELLVRTPSSKVSARYKPLVYQGLAIGDTAEVLQRDENQITFLGNYQYGYNDHLNFAAFIPGLFFGYYSFTVKKQFYLSNSHVLSWAAQVYHDKKLDSTQGTVRLYWDSINAGNQISHSVVTFNVEPFKKREGDLLNVITGTSLQTGYEFIQDNWDRILIGPKYNFDLKAIGGYASYMYIWDEFHLNLNLNATDVTSLHLDPEEGYFMTFELFWRY